MGFLHFRRECKKPMHGKKPFPLAPSRKASKRDIIA
jgi:hypothetical protein